MEINKCPVCNHNVDNGICRHCGYTQIVWPESLPESISNFEKERVKTLREIRENTSLKIRDIEGRRNVLETNLESLEGALSEARKKNERLTDECEELNEKNRSQIRKIKSLEDANNIAENDAKTARRKFEEEISDLKAQISRQKSEILNLTADLTEAREKAKNLSETLNEHMSRSSKAGNVYFILDDDGEFSVIPVPENKHFFATGPGIESCHASEDSISMLPVMTTAKAVFSVEKSLTGGYRLTDLAGTLISSGVMKENKIRLTQGVSLKIRGGNFKLYFCINQN